MKPSAFPAILASALILGCSPRLDPHCFKIAGLEGISCHVESSSGSLVEILVAGNVVRSAQVPESGEVSFEIPAKDLDLRARELQFRARRGNRTAQATVPIPLPLRYTADVKIVGDVAMVSLGVSEGTTGTLGGRPIRPALEFDARDMVLDGPLPPNLIEDLVPLPLKLAHTPSGERMQTELLLEFPTDTIRRVRKRLLEREAPLPWAAERRPGPGPRPTLLVRTVSRMEGEPPRRLADAPAVEGLHGLQRMRDAELIVFVDEELQELELCGPYFGEGRHGMIVRQGWVVRANVAEARSGKRIAHTVLRGPIPRRCERNEEFVEIGGIGGLKTVDGGLPQSELDAFLARALKN